MSMQSTFDAILAHLRAQGKPALAPAGYGTQCSYRGDGGTKCAVGCLIPDELYSPDIEGNSMAGLPDEIHSYLWKLVGAPGDAYWRTFLRECQQAHDASAAPPYDNWLPHMEARMEAVARKYNLTFKETEHA